MAQAVAAPLRLSSRQSTAAIAAHLSSLLLLTTTTPTNPHLNLPPPFIPHRRSRFLSTSPFVGPPKSPTPRGYPAYADFPDDESDDSTSKKSRNELKREARRAVRWGMELANFSNPQIKRVLRVAALEPEVFDALIVVKKLGPNVREGKRRQFNYIGRLLRAAQPELMDALIQASKDGDKERLLALAEQQMLVIEDEEEEEEEDDDDEETESEEEYGGNFVEVASRWCGGLICKDVSITNEVYSIHNVEFDRQELRKLVRRVQSIQEDEDDAKLTRAKKPLIRFLNSLSKKALLA